MEKQRERGDLVGKKKRENAISVKRIPRSEELFNVGKQPSIPTRGFSTIISDKPKRKVLKISMKELTNNRFEHE